MIVQSKFRYMGKKLSLFILLFFIFLNSNFVGIGNNLFPQENIPSTDSIKSYPGIPLVTYLYEIAGLEDPNVLDKVDSLGFHSAIINDLTLGKYNSFGLGDYVFKIIPNQVTQSVVGSGRDLINRYTEAKYSVWQAEGTPPEDGMASVYMNNTYTQKAENDTVIRTKTVNIPKGTELINGPSYWQEGSYFAVRADTAIQYTANFYMKIEDLIQQESLPTDTICELQVTTSYIIWDTLDYHVIDTLTVRYGDFTALNQWQRFPLNYDLTGLPDSLYNFLGGRFINPPSPSGWNSALRNTIQNVEYKIIWKGNSQIVRLYVDKIILSDQRGRDLHTTAIQSLILNMLNASYITGDYENKISGWIGLDEPNSLDNFEAIRIINELLESQAGGAKIWISLQGSWNGRYGHWAHPSPGQRLHRVDEFFLRVKRANVLQNFYPLNSPCLPDNIECY